VAEVAAIQFGAGLVGINGKEDPGVLFTS